MPSPADPDRIHRELGLLLFRQGRYRASQDEFNKVRIAQPQDPRPVFSLGLVEARLGEVVKAESRFKEALTIDPAFTPAQMSLGVLAYNRGQYPEALELFKAALAAHPPSSDVRDALFYLTVTWLALGEPAQAQAAADRLRQADPATAQAADGILLYHRGRYKDALAHLVQAEQADPDRALVYYYEGLAYYAMDRFDRVSPRMLRAKTLDPGLAPGALYYSGLAYYREGGLIEAREDLQTVFVTAPESALGRSAQAFLLDIAKLERFGRPWDLSLGIVPQYDTNVISQPNDKPLATDISRQSDSGAATQLVAAYRPYQTDRWTVTGRYTFLEQYYLTLTKNNVQNHDLALLADARQARVQTRLQYSYTYAILEKAAFSTAHTLTPTVTMAMTPHLVGVLQTQVKLTDFVASSNADRAGTNLLAGYSQMLLWAGGQGNVRLAYTYDRDSTRGADWVYTGQKGTAAVAGPFPLRLSFDLSGEFYHKGYENRHSQFGIKRYDDTTTGSVGLTRGIGKAVTASLRYVYIRNVSNLADFDYTRQMTSLTLQWRL